MKKLILVLVLSIVLLNGSSVANGASSKLTIHPNGDAGTNQWTAYCFPASCSQHYEAVDEVTTSDVDYVYTATLNNLDEWTMQDVTGTILAGAVIDSVVLIERGYNQTALMGRTAGLKIGSDYTWGAQRVDTKYTTHNQKLSAPGGRTWTRSNLDSLVVSVKKSASASNSVYTSWACDTVYYTPAVSGFDTTAVTATSVSLKCNKNTNTDYKRYKVMYSAGSTPPDSQNQSGITYGDSSTADDDTVFAVGSLSVNTQYSFSVFAKDAVPNWTQKGSGSYKTCYSKANTPSVPTISAPSCTSMYVTVNSNSNPSTTQFAIGVGANYVQTNGTLSGTAAWQDSATWGIKRVTGLSSNTTYYFKVKARNGDNLETAFGDSVIQNTSNTSAAACTVYVVADSSPVQWSKYPTGSATHYELVDELAGSPDDDNTMIRTITDAKFDWFIPDSFQINCISNGETIDSVVVKKRVRCGSGAGEGTYTYLKAGSDSVNSGLDACTDTYANQSWSRTTHPSGSAWTKTNLKSTLLGIKSYKIDSWPACTQIYYVVYHSDKNSPAAVTTLDTSLADGGIDTTQIGLRSNKNDSADCGGYMVRYAAGDAAPSTYSAGTFGDSTSSRNDTTFTITGLSVNALYSFSVFARDEVPNWSSLGAMKTLYTKAKPPSAPTVATPTSSTLNVTVRKNGNPVLTEFAIWITPAVGGNNYVQANGSIGASAVWQDSSHWETKTVTGLSHGVAYYFKVKAHNGDNIETSFSDSTGLRTIGPCYVRKSGSNSNNGGTSSAAWLTISYAVSQMRSGDTVWIGAGDYSAESLIVTDKNYTDWTCFFGDYDGSHTGDVAGEVKIHSICGDTDWGKAHFDHLHVIHWSDCGASYASGVSFRNDTDGRLKITHCVVDTSVNAAQTQYVEFTNNFVKDHGGKEFWASVHFDDVDTCYIYNNTMGSITNTSGYLVLYLRGNSTNHYWVRNNLFYRIGNSNAGYIGLESYATVHWEDINYNYFDTSYANGYFSQFKRTDWIYTANLGVWRDSTPFDDNSDTGATGLDTDNYHLLGSSACIDAGTSNVSALVTDDIDGESRPLNNGYDIGCDERLAFILSISASPTTWDLDTLSPSQIKTMTSGERIFAKNTGNVAEQLSLKIDTMDTKGEWSCSESKGGQAQNTYVMSGVFCDPHNENISEEHFNQVESDDVIDTVIQWADASSEIFAVEKDTYGASVAVGDSVALWLQMKMPTTASGPKADSTRNIIIQIGCQQAP